MVMFLSSFSVGNISGISVFADDEATSGTCGDGVTWSYDADTTTLTISGEGYMEDWTAATSVPWYTFRSSISKVVITFGVLSIGHSSFAGCSALTEISIPDSVTTIGGYAFYECKSLTSILLPDSILYLGEYVFFSCEKLESLTIPENVVKIGDFSIYGCRNLSKIIYKSNKINFESNLTGYNSNLKTAGPIGGGYDIEFCWTDAIPDNAFYGCTGLTDITFPVGLEKIGSHAFYMCHNLTEIIIPDTVKTISNSAFSSCGKIKHLVIPVTVGEVGSSAFSGCISLETAGPVGEGYDFEFEWTGSIPSYTFSGCSGLKTIVLPDSITSIGNYAFSKCSTLQNINIPSSVSTIGICAFSGCECLSNVIIPKGVKKLETSTFSGCSSLSSITIPGSVSSIGSDVFANCSQLTIYCCPNTYAETYAKKNSINYSSSHTAGEPVIEEDTPATCTEGYNYEITYCTKCGKVLEYNVITLPPVSDHTLEEIPAVEPTCTSVGYTAGTQCSVCGEIITEPQVIEKTEHTLEEIPAVDPTCTSVGYTAGAKCSVCGEVITEPQVVGKVAHTLTELPAVEATCTSTGLTAGTKCSVCGAVIKAQTVISKKSHSYTWTYNNNATYTSDGTETEICSVCNATRNTRTAAGTMLKFSMPSYSSQSVSYNMDVTLSISITNVPDGCTVYIDGHKADQSGNIYTYNIGSLSSSKDIAVEVRSGNYTIGSTSVKINVQNSFFSSLMSWFSNYLFNGFKWKKATVSFK